MTTQAPPLRQSWDTFGGAVYDINVEKYCTDGQATDDNTKRRMHFACWITKATNTHTEYF